MFNKKPKQVQSDTIKDIEANKSVAAPSLPSSNIVRPLVKLDVDKLKNIDDVREVLRTMDIMFPRELVYGKEVERFCDMSAYINSRAEKMHVVFNILRFPIDRLSAMTDSELDGHYIWIVNNLFELREKGIVE